jgi:uncharacterized protein (TIGR01777 family)
MQRGESESSEQGVLLTGATGLVGGCLLPELAKRFSFVRTLSRSASNPTQREWVGARLEARRWDGSDPGESALDGVDTVIHLAGEPIFGGLPTVARMARVRASRIDSTRKLVDRLLARAAGDRPVTLICASAVGIYGDRGEELLAEAASAGAGFLAELCRDWELEAERAREAGVRVVSLRIGVVLSSAGGALGLMKIPFRLGLGGRLGGGQQFFPWIQLDDLVRAILFCIDGSIEGPVNAVAPEAIRNRDLTKALGRVLRRPTILPVPEFVLRLILGEIADELLGSRRVVPEKLQRSGFVFDFPDLQSALRQELG